MRRGDRPIADAELLAIGSEMLRFGRRDTNGDWLTSRLNDHGVEVVARSVVEDSVDRLAAQLTVAAGRADLVIATGGLGPTADDVTREAFSRAFELELDADPACLARVRAWFDERGRNFDSIQAVQAEKPRGAEWIDNPIGTAPGFALNREGRVIVALPGVPAEMKAMFEATVAPLLPGRGTGGLVHRSLRVGGRSESWVEGRVRHLYGHSGVEVTILSGGEGIELHLRASGSDPVETGSRVGELEGRMREILGDDVYGTADDSLAGVVGDLLARREATVATAESCTAGLLSAALTATPGSTAWFRGGWVVYHNDLKRGLAGVEAIVLERHGAVSEPVARTLAEAARDRCGADYGVGITGVAGPGGGTAAKPVGLVHVAIAGPEATGHWERRMVGDRDLVRRRTVVFALDRLRRLLSGAQG